MTRWSTRLAAASIAVATLAAATARADIAPPSPPECLGADRRAPCVTAGGEPGECLTRDEILHRGESSRRTGPGAEPPDLAMACSALVTSRTAEPATPTPEPELASGCAVSPASSLPARATALVALGLGLAMLGIARRRARD